MCTMCDPSAQIKLNRFGVEFGAWLNGSYENGYDDVFWVWKSESLWAANEKEGYRLIDLSKANLLKLRNFW